MKVGDLVIMGREILPVGATHPVGIIVADDYPNLSIVSRKRIGVVWTDGGGAVDYEPQAWLEVISERR